MFTICSLLSNMNVLKLTGLKIALFALAVGAMLLLTNVRLAATRPEVYEYSFSRYEAVERTGVPRAELDRAAREIIAYFGSGHVPYLAIEVAVDGQTDPLFNQRELLHMRDVRELFRAAFMVQQVAIGLVTLYLVVTVVRYRRAAIDRLAREAVLAGGGIGVVLALTAVAMLFAFHWLFTQFHLLSFANDFWMLDPRTDRLVQMFPDGFWFDVALGVGILTFVEATLVALFGYMVLRLRGRGIRDASPARARAALKQRRGTSDSLQSSGQSPDR